MIAESVPVKTAAGQAELQTRRLRISQRHRTVLFLVDGRRSESMVRNLSSQAGVPDACFDELVGLGLIAQAEAGAMPVYAPIEEGPPSGSSSVLHIELPLFAPTVPATLPASLDDGRAGDDIDSLLPPSQTLAPDSAIDSTHRGAATERDSWFEPEAGADVGDKAFLQARELMMRAVRSEAPVSGSLTLRRLRRARTRNELVNLLGEVEVRISKPFRSLAAKQTLGSVRELLGRPVDTSPAAL